MAFFDNHYHRPGTAPGTLVANQKPVTPVTIQLIDYTDSRIEEHRLASARDCQKFLARETKTWIQVNGHVDADTLNGFGEMFDLHDLALEDVINRGQRPKTEVYDDQVFIVAALPAYDGRNLELVQVSLFVGENYLICFCPLAEDPFEPIRKRMRQPGNRHFSNRGIDYLLYALMDFIIDAGFPVLEQFGAQLEALEEDLLDSPDQDTLSSLHKLKRELLTLRRVLWPQRDLVATLMRGEDKLIHMDTLVYFRDCYGHSIQIIELLESFRDMSTGMLDLYLSSVSQRTNDTMRVLTIIATVFIPLTFVVGVYGMNFNHSDSPWAMPELNWYYGYPMVWGVMVMTVLGMVWFFRRRHWI
ncbi:magnesium/cobalt transporter CorA [Marinobacter sp. F3R11]|uniref:magnesium/cobalt transporter CorA n=1 Tax=Marinobacter sp. F3R11 TaxID=2267231 RepID=UPI000DE9B5C8|nr:magnesium/cobalt transporter CorA [Marinobacter sp. F3R11]RBW48563.1 magnesium and cobalt transport protein CorA [Marinobacter sp. F3R11]